MKFLIFGLEIGLQLKTIGLLPMDNLRNWKAYIVESGLISKEKFLYHLTLNFFKFRFSFLENWSQIYFSEFFFLNNGDRDFFTSV